MFPPGAADSDVAAPVVLEVPDGQVEHFQCGLLGGELAAVAGYFPQPGVHGLESLNYQLRKVIKARGHFPGDDAVIKLLWLAIINIEDKRARERAARRDQAGASAPTSPAG